jgi:hypothetical protein
MLPRSPVALSVDLGSCWRGVHKRTSSQRRFTFTQFGLIRLTKEVTDPHAFF